MLARLILLLTLVPALELAILIPLGSQIGIIPTLALIFVTGVIGAVLAKKQGVAAWKRIQSDLSSGKMPGDSLLDGLAVLIAGAFLVTPGVLTDVAGMVLLIPPLRRPVKAYLKKRFRKAIDSGSVSYVQVGGSWPPGADAGASSGYEEDDVIDVTPEESATAEEAERQHLS